MEIGFLFSFLAGVAAIFSPCILPLLPIVVGWFLTKKRVKEAFSFTLGVFLVFVVVAVLVGLFTVAINRYLTYFRVVAGIIIIFLGALLLAGESFSFPLQVDGEVGSFTLGILVCLAWSPCYGPYLATIIAFIAARGGFIFAFTNILLFAVAFTLTIFIISLVTVRAEIEKMPALSGKVRVISGLLIVCAGTYLTFEAVRAFL